MSRVALTQAPPADRPSLRLERYDTVEDLQRLEGRWEQLLTACPAATPFQSPAWVLPWFKHFSQGQVRAWAALRGDRLTALAVCTVVEQEGQRRLRFVGGDITDYNGMLIHPEEDAAWVAGRCLAALLEDGAGWDVAVFDQLQADDPLLSVPTPAGWASQRHEQEVCPVVPLPSTADSFLEQLPNKLGPRILRCIRRLERAGRFAFERADADSEPAFMEALFRLHAARWNERDMAGVLSSIDLQGFHREVAARMRRAGMLRLCGFRFDGELKAVVYAFAHGDRFFSYIGGFEPALAPFSPGLVILWHAMNWAIEEGRRGFDFLRGDEAYKDRFGPRRTRNQSRVFYRG